MSWSQTLAALNSACDDLVDKTDQSSPIYNEVRNLVMAVDTFLLATTANQTSVITQLQSLLATSQLILSKITTTGHPTPTPSTPLMPLPMCVVELIPQMRPFSF